MRHLTFPILLISALLMMSYSCGSYYAKNVAVKDNASTLSKKESIENAIRSNFDKDYSYKSITYGTSSVLKPRAYRELDSLFAIKYDLQQKGKRDEQLEKRIQIQKAKAESETNPILYVENHVFSMTRNDSSIVINANFYLNKQNQVQRLEVVEALDVPKILWNTYTYWLFEDNILSPGNTNPTQNDRDFYKVYKGHANTLVGTQRDEFIIHTLRVMDVIKLTKSYSKTGILKSLVKTLAHADGATYTQSSFEAIEEEVNSDDEVLSYIVKYSYSNDKLKTVVKNFRFDPFLQLIPSAK